MSSPSRGDDLTLVVPFTKPPDSDEVFGAPTQRVARQHNAHQDSSIIEDADNFTMVMPFGPRPGSSGRPSSGHRPSSSGSHIPVPTGSTPRLSPQKATSASPLNISRLRSPAGRSPERLRSPLPGSIANAEAEPVQVYEDPFTSHDSPLQATAGAIDENKPVLEELPIERANERLPSEETQALSQSTRSNEQNIDVQRTPRHHKTTSTGSVIAMNGNSDNAEVLRSRRLLASGIERIRAKTLDAHGFRRVQDIVKNNGDEIWGPDGAKFGELLIVLLEYLEAPNESLKASGSGSAATKAQSLKGQVLATIRAMLSLHRGEAKAWYARALVGVVRSRKMWDESMHITAEIERTADEIVKSCNPVEGLNAILDLLEQLGAAPTSPASTSSSMSSGALSPPLSAQMDTHRTASFALTTLASLLSSKSTTPISKEMNHRLGTCAVKYLQDPDSDVRKADLDFLLVWNRVAASASSSGEGEKGEAEFWGTLRGLGVKEGSVNLITYYIAKGRKNAA